MDRLELTKWAKKLQVSPVEIIREEREVFILDRLSQSPIGGKIVFKGGTALRLIYGSPRFSQDLDFSLKSSLSVSDLKKVLAEIVNEYKDIGIKDIYNKRYTLFAFLIVKPLGFKQSFSIKIEISKRDKKLRREDWSLMAVRSPISILTPLVYSCSLKRILFEKKIALKNRSEPRDYFDLWWIDQKLNLNLKIPKPKVAESKFKGEINQLLPNYLKNWSKDFLTQYEK